MSLFKPVDTRRPVPSYTLATVHAHRGPGWIVRLRADDPTGPVVRELGVVFKLSDVPGLLAGKCPEKTWRRSVPEDPNYSDPVLLSLRADDPSFYEVWT